MSFLSPPRLFSFSAGKPPTAQQNPLHVTCSRRTFLIEHRQKLMRFRQKTVSSLNPFVAKCIRMKTLIKAFAGAAAMILAFSPSFGADTAKGGGKKLIELTTPAQIAAVEKGDLVVTTCPRCKTVVQTRVKATAKGGGIGKEEVALHACPGCSAKVDVTGHGKAKVDKITHVCSHCGSSEAFCSLLKKKDAK